VTSDKLPRDGQTVMEDLSHKNEAEENIGESLGFLILKV
jgi:hypothetical protein